MTHTIFLTYKQPVELHNGAYKPVYDPSIDYMLPHAFFRRHYVQRYNKDKAYMWCEVTIKSTIKRADDELSDLLEVMQTSPVAELIETPSNYKNF